MAVREAHPKPLALETAAMRPGHVCCRPGLVDEDEPCRIEILLRREPVTALLQDVRTVLLDRVAVLGLSLTGGVRPRTYFRVTPWRWKNRERLDVDVAMPRSARRPQSSSSV